MQNNSDNIITIIQARMGSNRLPGKILEEIVGKPMLWHVVNRIGYTKIVNKVVVATTVNKIDDLVENLCKKNNIDFYRGSEFDVLDRYYNTAKIWNADVIVRITSDCPLIDPVVADRVISAYLGNKNNLDGSSNIIKRTFPQGLDVEVISFNTLERVWKEAKKDYQREHVTIYIYENISKFKILNVENDKNLSYLRWTVDEKKDLEFVRQVYKSLNNKNIFLMDDIVRLLEENPSIKEINRDVKQKKIIK